MSGVVPVPPWQAAAGVPAHGALNGSAWLDASIPDGHRPSFVGRGVPDVAAYADQIPGYLLVLGGVQTSAGGTSAATPLWAGLVARLAQALGRPLPWLHQMVYDPLVASAFRPITQGDNAIGSAGAATFKASRGWNACCGLGVPDGAAMLDRLRRALAVPEG